MPMNPTPNLLADLHATRAQMRLDRTSAFEQVEACIASATTPTCARVFLRPSFDTARSAAQDPRNRPLVLAGLGVSVKDLFDVAGQVTSAGSRVLSDALPAAQDCPAVARLRLAGGAIMGRTNMSEFAFSGVGTNPHFGTPAAVCGAVEPRIPGGSSSGAAVSVAAGAAFVGLGSDTGGSIRIPAALNGIVGFKSTARLVPTEGALPLSTTLDTVCALTRSVRDAITVHEILAQRQVALSGKPVSGSRLAVSTRLMQDDLDPTVARAWERSLEQLRALGAQVLPLELPELDELPALQIGGGLTGAESYAWHRSLLQHRGADYDPRVRARIERGAQMLAWEYLELLRARRGWIARMEQRLQGFDAVLSPTVPIVAPAISAVAPGRERDDAFFAVNARLLRNTSVVNLLDGCAISVPCHAPDELPVGLMLWHAALHDDAVLNLALAVEQAVLKQ